MRFALCDGDRAYTDMIETMLNELAHDVIGLATTTADSVALLEAARPEVVIVDVSLGFNSDYDVVGAAASVGATAIVFSQRADDSMLGRYEVRPTVVYKPDLTKLELVVGRLGFDANQQAAEQERRTRPGRAAAGPAPTSLGDAQAFYVALDEASAGDALISIGLGDHHSGTRMASDAATRVGAVLRSTDRLLMSPTGMRVFLPAGGAHGVASLHTRLVEADALPADATIRSVVIEPDESPSEAFDRLKSASPR
jgi:hypothetical protein